MGIFNFLFSSRHTDESEEEQAREVHAWINGCFEKFPDAGKIRLASNGCDKIQGGKGVYGRCMENPIPVNGPSGELKYLGMLSPVIFFHRLGSLYSTGYGRHLDIYESVSMRSRRWDLLYFDMFHPRRSRVAPSGFKMHDYHKIFCSVSFVRGTNEFDKTFPHAIPDLMRERIGGSLGEKIANKVLPHILGKNFKRPLDHHKQVQSILKTIDGQTSLDGEPVVKKDNVYQSFSIQAHNEKEQAKKLDIKANGDYKKGIDVLFASNIPEWKKRATCIYVVLKDRIYTEVFPKAFLIYKTSVPEKPLDNEKARHLWGKLVACGIYIMTNTILGHYDNDPELANNFNKNVLLLFLSDFKQPVEIFLEYEKNTSFGKGQAVFALGKTICDALDIKSIVLASEFSTLFRDINRVEINTVSPILSMSLSEVSAMVKSVAIQHAPDNLHG